MRKRRYLLGLIALMAIAALGFTACPQDQEYTYTFTNRTVYLITVTCKDLDPGSLTLPGVVNDAVTPIPQTATSKKSLTTRDISWSISGLDSTQRDRQVKFTLDGTGALFVKNDDEGFASILQAQE